MDVEEERRVFNEAGRRTSVPIPAQQMLSRTLRQPDGLGDALGYARVVDAPFVAVDADLGEDRITFTTNLGEVVTAGPENAIRIATGADGTPRPYVHVRRGLEALIDRKTFYRLVDAARPDATGGLVLRSEGVDFPLEG